MICAVVAAAGQSRRMGSQKLLLPLGGRPVIRWVVDRLLASPVHHVLVVVGSESQGIRAALADCPVHWAVNPDPTGDMLSSLRCGLQALPADCRAVLIALGDQPGISPAVVAELIAALEAGARIAVPTCNGRRGHPLLLGIEYRQEILQQHDGVGLRGLLLAHPQAIREVAVAEPQILEDMDLPEDYRRIAEHWESDAG